MEALKQNLYYVICGLVATAGIVLGTLGFKEMGKVSSEMGQAQVLLRQFPQAERDPINWAGIRKAEERVKVIRDYYARVMDWVRRINRRPLLVEGVFPEPRGQLIPQFRNAYYDELDELRGLLKAGEPPSAREIAAMRDIILNERPRGPDASTARKRDAKSAKPEEHLSGLITDEKARHSASTRAALAKAHKCYCYAGPETFQVMEGLSRGGLDLPPALLWDAQRVLWVEQDVVQALARVNEAAAQKLEEEGRTPWVGVLPVKDVVSIRVSKYVLEDSKGRPPAGAAGDDPALPPGTIDESYTGYGSNDLYDVMQFTVKLVVDARQIPRIMRELCGDDQLRTPLRIAYQVVPPNLNMTDKIYGEDPTVRLVVDFEAYYLGEIYRPLMPDAVLEALGQERPTPPEEGRD